MLSCLLLLFLPPFFLRYVLTLLLDLIISCPATGIKNNFLLRQDRAIEL